MAIKFHAYSSSLKQWAFVKLTLKFDDAGGVYPMFHLELLGMLDPYDIESDWSLMFCAFSVLFVASASALFFMRMGELNNFLAHKEGWRRGLANYLTHDKLLRVGGLVSTALDLWLVVVWVEAGGCDGDRPSLISSTATPQP